MSRRQVSPGVWVDEGAGHASAGRRRGYVVPGRLISEFMPIVSAGGSTLSWKSEGADQSFHIRRDEMHRLRPSTSKCCQPMKLSGAPCALRNGHTGHHRGMAA